MVNRDGAMEETVQQIEAILLAEKARVARRCGDAAYSNIDTMTV